MNIVLSLITQNKSGTKKTDVLLPDKYLAIVCGSPVEDDVQQMFL